MFGAKATKEAQRFINAQKGMTKTAAAKQFEKLVNTEEGSKPRGDIYKADKADGKPKK